MRILISNFTLEVVMYIALFIQPQRFYYHQYERRILHLVFNSKFMKELAIVNTIRGLIHGSLSK